MRLFKSSRRSEKDGEAEEEAQPSLRDKEKEKTTNERERILRRLVISIVLAKTPNRRGPANRRKSNSQMII